MQQVIVKDDPDKVSVDDHLVDGHAISRSFNVGTIG